MCGFRSATRRIGRAGGDLKATGDRVMCIVPGLSEVPMLAAMREPVHDAVCDVMLDGALRMAPR